MKYVLARQLRAFGTKLKLNGESKDIAWCVAKSKIDAWQSSRAAEWRQQRRKYSKMNQDHGQPDIVSVVGHYVTLKQAGSTLKGLCPFHKEKTPSFHVNPARGFFHCFGCGKAGDVLAFEREIANKTEV